MPLTFADLAAIHGPKRGNEIYCEQVKAERARKREANAEIRAHMRDLGIAEDAAIIAANLLQAYPTDPNHGLGVLADEPMMQAKVRSAMAAYGAAQARKAAA